MAVPLTDDELNTLDLFLHGEWGEVSSIEMLDGFFAALLVGPELIMPSRYLPHIIGDPEDPDGPGGISARPPGSPRCWAVSRHSYKPQYKGHDGGERIDEYVKRR
jgi:hypothetical protein